MKTDRSAVEIPLWARDKRARHVAICKLPGIVPRGTVRLLRGDGKHALSTRPTVLAVLQSPLASSISILAYPTETRDGNICVVVCAAVCPTWLRSVENSTVHASLQLSQTGLPFLDSVSSHGLSTILCLQPKLSVLQSKPLTASLEEAFDGRVKQRGSALAQSLIPHHPHLATLLAVSCSMQTRTVKSQRVLAPFFQVSGGGPKAGTREV